MIVIVGGGATGLGVLWDLALRGLPALLVERGDLAHGTTGRFHGLLHSGGRYAVSDPGTAAECARENAILRRVAPAVIEPCGGYFLSLPQDPPEYADAWTAACQRARVRVREVAPEAVLRREPALHPGVRRAFEVPDAGIDSFRLCERLRRAAEALGAKVRTRCRLEAVEARGGQVQAVRLRDLRSGQAREEPCDLLVNAAGAWAGEVARLAGCDLRLVPTVGAHLIFAQRFQRAVYNRLRPPGDGDILVPHDLVSILGTTSAPVDVAPERPAVSAGEARRLLDLGTELVPDLPRRRVLRAFAGVRPLYDGVSRGFAVINHGCGLISVLGGKLTTFRLMAERCADEVCGQLGRAAPCRTGDTPLTPGRDGGPAPKSVAWASGLDEAGLERARRRLGPDWPAVAGRLARGEDTAVLCECEQVTVAEARIAGTERPGELRRRTWFGMGPCQGTFCGLRGATLLGFDVQHLLTERRRGLAPVMWGQQAMEAALQRALYARTLGLAIPGEPSPGPEWVAPPGAADVVVIGAGLAGLVAAASAQAAGHQAVVLASGEGSWGLWSGCVDLHRGGLDPWAGLAACRPPHPYALLGRKRVEEALAFVAEALGWPLGCWRLLTPAGTEKRCVLCPPEMAAGDLAGPARRPVDIPGLLDWNAAWLARRAGLGAPVPASVPWDAPARGWDARRLAARLDRPEGRAWLRSLPAEPLLFPAVLPEGCPPHLAAAPALPPSVPGLRAQHRLRERLPDVRLGTTVTAVERDRDGWRLAGEGWELAAGRVVVATGGPPPREGLVVAGTALGGSDPDVDGSGAGVAIATGYWAGRGL